MKKNNGVLTFVDKDDIELLKNNPNLFWENITSIGDNAFSYRSNLTSIEIPDSVTSIGDGAFRNCSNLTNIVIPDSVTSIGTSAFSNCSCLTSIVIPDSVTSIGALAFAYCSSLTSIEIPASVTSIGRGAFSHCSNLTSIVIPDSVTSIGTLAFSNCGGLTSIVIPDSVTNIGDGAFMHCSSLTSIEIPNSVNSIEDYTFSGCSSLTSIVIPDSVTSIGYSALTDVPEVTVFGKRIAGNMLSEQMFNYFKENRDFNLAPFNKIYALAKDKGLNSYNRSEFETLCVNLGLLESKSTKMKIGTQKNGQPNMVPVSDVAYTFLQGLINSGDLELDALHMNLQEMKIEGYNEEFLKFVTNKTNWSDIKQNMTTLPRVYDWFKERTNLDLSQTSEGYLLPTSEENRFKICVYETTQNGVDRIKWKTPTMEYLLKEFVEKKFTGIDSSRNKEIAEEIGKFNIYSQKHYDKAKEIDRERIDSGVKDVLKNPVKQDRIASLDEYRAKTEAIKNQILSDSASILSDQITDTSNIFTYEVLSKSDPANFAMGCMTSCCATLYGAGAGAMRAMIIHPDIQPLVIRDFDNNIIAFGIIYVNRKQGYAVVNDFEVNSKYQNRQEQRKAIYEKALEGVKKFVEEYNEENPTKEIERVTCGCSPNWTAINDYIQSHPQSEILKAPNFDDFKYAGSGSWNGDWHRSQYEIWRKEEENERY